MDTTIKVDSRVRDRLAVLAAQRGISLRELVAGLAEATPTSEELALRAAGAVAAVRERFAPGLTSTDLEAAESVWRGLESGDTPPRLPTDSENEDRPATAPPAQAR